MKLSKVWKVINKWDPVKKLDGISIDEYKHEINRIASLHEKATETPEGLAKIIYDIFLSNYGKDEFKHSEEECLEVALKILEKTGNN